MELSFKKWMEMAVVARQPMPIDEDDIAYLKQFPVRLWPHALKMRYNDFLFDALDADGDLRSDWMDQQSIPVGRGFQLKHLKVKIGLPKVVEKLNKYGYDLRGVNKETRIFPYYTPMSDGLAQKLVKQLKKSDPDFKPLGRGKSVDSINPQPNAVNFSPNHNETRRDDLEPTSYVGHWPLGHDKRDQFASMKKQIEAEVKTQVGELANHHHINAKWWMQPDNYNELVNRIIERIWLNWNNQDLKLDTPTGRKQFIHLEIYRKALQGGIIPHRQYDKFSKEYGFDVSNLTKTVNLATGKNWTPEEIKDVVDSSQSYDDRLNMFRSGYKRRVSGVA